MVAHSCYKKGLKYLNWNGMTKSKKFSESYLKMGFTSVIEQWPRKTAMRFMLFCCQQRSNEAIKA